MSRSYWPEMEGEVYECVVLCEIFQQTNDGGKFVKAPAPPSTHQSGARSVEDGLCSCVVLHAIILTVSLKYSDILTPICHIP